MGFDLQTSVSALTVFFQGLLSFFSPCVLPLVPLYLSYLAGGAPEAALDKAARRRTLLNTFFFVLGISFAFFLLGMGFTALGQFFSRYRTAFTVAGGVVVLLMGVWQLFFGGISTKELRLPFRLDKWAMGPIPALVMGFTFSFAWTPCVGPTLTGVLLLVGSTSSKVLGFILISAYTLGFVIPFLLVGLFTGQMLRFFRSHMNWLKYTAKAGGALLILLGVLMISGKMSSFTGYLAGLGSGGTNSTSSSVVQQEDSSSQAEPDTSEPASSPDSASSSSAASDSQPEEQTVPAIDFSLQDQFGNTHTLADYEGKTILLNFWATWCGPCQQEMPDLQALYEEWGENEGDLVVLGVAAPKAEDSLYPADNKSAEEIAAWLDEQGYTYPVLMDTTGELFLSYGVYSFPTTFMIDTDGNVFGYLSGSMTREIMDSIVEQTMTGERVAG